VKPLCCSQPLLPPTMTPRASFCSNFRHLSLSPSINVNADIGLPIFKFVVDETLTRTGSNPCSTLRSFRFPPSVSLEPDSGLNSVRTCMGRDRSPLTSYVFFPDSEHERPSLSYDHRVTWHCSECAVSRGPLSEFCLKQKNLLRSDCFSLNTILPPPSSPPFSSSIFSLSFVIMSTHPTTGSDAAAMASTQQHPSPSNEPASGITSPNPAAQEHDGTEQVTVRPSFSHN
jgi:hypothetical protein